MAKENHSGSCCHAYSHPSSVHQTLNEMDFERGIWAAALEDDTAKISSHLEKGTDVNQPDTYGYTALHYAARNGNLEAVKLLLLNKADPNRKTRSGEGTPLQRAAYQGHVDIAKLLIQHGAIACTKDADGRTALHKAAERNQTQVCKFFVEKYPHLKLEMDDKGMKPYDLTTDETCRQLLQIT
ncbi:Ankyrin repeat domain-containing protein 39 [Chamberlinius hualienensis]